MQLDIYTTKSGVRHLYIKKSFRDKNGKSTSVNVVNLGTYDELSAEHEDPIAWGRALAKEMTEKEKEQKKPVQVTFDPNRQYTKTCSPIYNCGYLFAQQIYHEAGIDRICRDISKNRKFDYDLNDVLSRLIYGRILFPCSKLSTIEESKNLLEQPSFELHDIYRALDVIAEKSDFIQSELYKNSRAAIGHNNNILYYDCTNYFFETEEPSGLRQYGCSKEHRPNPIVEMGLFMDGNGIPLAFSIHPGNTNEQTTLMPLEKQIIEDFGKSNIVVCTDAGLSSNENRKFNDAATRSFITVQSVKQMKGYQKEWLFDMNGWYIKKDGEKQRIKLDEILSDDEKCCTYYDSVFFKEQWMKENGIEQRFIVTYSIKYRDYLRKIRRNQIDRAEKMIDRNANAKKQNDPKRFVKRIATTVEGEVAEKSVAVLDTDRIANEEKYDGYYCVATNLKDSVSDIISVNKRRWEIEESFRIMKTEFKARPVYLANDNRIKAHFMTCFLALYVYRVLEKKLNEKYPTDKIIDTLKNYNMIELSNEGYVPGYALSPIIDDLHKAFGFRTDFEFVTVSDMKNIIKKTKKH